MSEETTQPTNGNKEQGVFVQIQGSGPRGDASDRRQNVLKHTNRGFALYEFKDSYGEKCRLQKSSAGNEPCIWLGMSDAKVRLMAKDIELPLDYSKVFIPDSMHLTRGMVAKLLPMLQRFVETGDIDEDDEDEDEEAGAQGERAVDDGESTEEDDQLTGGESKKQKTQ